MLKNELFKCLCTIREMLVDRKIDFPPEAFSRWSPEELAAITQSRPTFNIDVDEVVRIVFDTSIKFKFIDVRKLVEEQEFPLYIIVSREKIGANDVKKMQELKVEFQVFEMRELQFNISKHILVPKHELIRDEAEIENIVKEHTLKSRHQLPIILKTDPQAKYLNAKPGNIVKITRYCSTAGEHVIYRCCM